MNLGISRYDMAQLMTNIMNKNGFAASESDKNAAVSQIADYNEIPSQYKDAVANVYALGIIGGYANGTFGGEVTMNRGQAAIVIYRMAQFSGNTAPEIPVDTTPITSVEPETPTTGKTLANGKAITEANVTEILTSLQARYPTGTSFVNGYDSLGSGRTGSKNCITQVTKDYTFEGRTTPGTLSTTLGCGGWAAFVADEIFGQTDVTWKKTTISNARPGDLVILLNSEGKLIHAEIFINAVSSTKIRITAANPNSITGYSIGWANTSISGKTHEVWTA